MTALSFSVNGSLATGSLDKVLVWDVDAFVADQSQGVLKLFS